MVDKDDDVGWKSIFSELATQAGFAGNFRIRRHILHTDTSQAVFVACSVQLVHSAGLADSMLRSHNIGIPLPAGCFRLTRRKSLR